MKLPKLPEGYAWKVLSVEDELYIGINPADGYKWTVDTEMLSEDVKYAIKLPSRDTKDVLESAVSLKSIVFDTSIVKMSSVVQVEDEDEIQTS